MPLKPISLATLLSLCLIQAMTAATSNPSLFFREDFAETGPETPITQAHIANEALVLSLHGPGRDGIKKSNHDHIPNDPYYVWSGTADGNWAVSLKKKDSIVDLSGPKAAIVWRGRQSGFRRLHAILQLEDDTWLVSEQAHVASDDWEEHMFNVADTTWRELDTESILERGRIGNPDLSRVRSIGWTDLMTGGRSPASSRVDWIEVHGKAVSPN